MRAWLVLYWTVDWSSMEWKFFYKEQQLIEFLLGDEYANIKGIYEVENLKDVKQKYYEQLQSKPEFKGVMFNK